MRDRLIELIKSAADETARIFKIESEECLKKGELPQHKRTIYDIEADYLIENGVIVPPCKVGQTVFRLVKLHGYGDTRIVEGTVFEITATFEYGEIKHRFYFWEKGTTSKHINRYSLWCDFDQIGKSVFLTKEEAKQALRKEDEGK